MKIKSLFTVGALSLCVLFSGTALVSCGPQNTMSKTGKGAVLGAGGGAALGAIIGAIAGKGKGAAIGAAIGAGVGAGTGAVIGRRMDKQAAELAKIENAKVEQVTDNNNLQAIKVTFESGILFPTNGVVLSSDSRAALSQFARSVIEQGGTDITVYGHTDNTGSREVNERISAQRAAAVATYLTSKGVIKSRIATQGMAYDMPVADNSTAQGRALNRRVEIYITASSQLINDVNSGKLQ